MKTFAPPTVPEEPGQVPGFLRRLMVSIQQAAFRPEPFLELQELHEAPAKVRAGMVVLADGTDWDPGSGAGFYGYYGAAWVKLG